MKNFSQVPGAIGSIVRWATFLGLFLPFFTMGSVYSSELSVRVPPNPYPPFFIKSESGEWEGLSIELTEALLKVAGFKPKYTSLPFKRALKYLGNGSLDMMLNLTVTKDRESYINFIGPQLDETVVLVTMKNANFEISTLDDLKKLKKPIIVELGKLYGEEFEQKRATDKAFAKKISVVRRLVSGERMLMSGHTDGFLGYGYHVFWRFKTNPMYENFAVHPYIFRQDWVHFGFSEKSVSADILAKLSAAYKKLEQDGTLDEIRNRYTLD